LATSLVRSSTLFRSRTGWEDAVSVSNLFFDHLAPVAANLPPDTTIHFQTEHKREPLTPAFSREVGLVKSARYLHAIDIQAWLNLHFPQKRLRATVKRHYWPPTPSPSIVLDQKWMGDRELVVTIYTLRDSTTDEAVPQVGWAYNYQVWAASACLGGIGALGTSTRGIPPAAPLCP
jgi:hypothetical protein